MRHIFGDVADQIVIANTKGLTGHAMATGIEDVLAVKALETGLLPPVANFKEVDPELGPLNLSKGGAYPVEYAIHLAAGFGSQISMMFLRWIPTKNGVRPSPDGLGYAYRIADTTAWNAWLTSIAGYNHPELQVVQRTLRVRDQGAASRLQPSVTQAAAPPAPTPRVEAHEPAPVRSSSAATVATPAAATPPTPPYAVGAAAAAPAKEQPAQAVDVVRERVLALVSEKTGYPTDMLDVDLDLEADLGVDTVKQAEVFASIREAYSIPREDNLRLREFPTLAHVIRFVYDRRPDLHSVASEPAPTVEAANAPLSVPAPAAAGETKAVEDPVKERILALMVEKTGYPKDMLDLDLDLEADLGVDTVKQAELFAAVRDIYNIERDENRKLRDYPTLAHVIRFVYEQRPDLAVTRATAVSTAPVSAQLAAGVVSAATAPLPTTTAAAAVDPVRERILDLVVEKTGYPKDMLDLDLDLEADLGVDTVKQAELFAAVRDIYNIQRDENRKLRDYPTLSHVIRFVYEQRPDLAATATATAAATAAPRLRK